MCEEPWHSVVDKKDYNKFCKVLVLKMPLLCIEVYVKKRKLKVRYYDIPYWKRMVKNGHFCATKLAVLKKGEEGGGIRHSLDM